MWTLSLPCRLLTLIHLLPVLTCWMLSWPWTQGQRSQHLGEVLLSEWLIVNTRIMDKLLEHMVTSVIRDYWSKSIKVGELLNDHEEDHLQVVQHDWQYRQLQSRHEFWWKINIKDACSFISNANGKIQSQNTDHPSITTTLNCTEEVRVCGLYNKMSGCTYGGHRCRSMHGCMKCHVMHPCFAHHDADCTSPEVHKGPWLIVAATRYLPHSLWMLLQSTFIKHSFPGQNVE